MEQLEQKIKETQNYLNTLYMLKRRKDEGEEVTDSMISAFTHIW